MQWRVKWFLRRVTDSRLGRCICLVGLVCSQSGCCVELCRAQRAHLKRLPDPVGHVTPSVVKDRRTSFTTIY